MLLVPAPSYSLAQAAWIPRVMIWRDDGTFERRDGEWCASWAEGCGRVGGLASQGAEAR